MLKRVNCNSCKTTQFYPITSYQIQKLSIEQHNVLAFLKKNLIKTFLNWTHEIAFVYLSICTSLFNMRGFIVGNLNTYNREDLWLSLLWYSPLKVGLTRLVDFFLLHRATISAIYTHTNTHTHTHTYIYKYIFVYR